MRRFVVPALLTTTILTADLFSAHRAVGQAIQPPAVPQQRSAGAPTAQTSETPPTPTHQTTGNVAPGDPSAALRPASINGVPLELLVPISQPIKLHARQIFSRGQQLDNNALAFTAIGDSTIAGGQFLSRFGKGDYKLGEYAYLQDVIDAFAPSFTRQSTAIRIGLHSWSVMNPAWADKSKCKPNETVIACEFRLHKPSIVFIRLGANDVAARLFDRSMRKIVEYSIESGVIPVEITTFEGVTGVRIEGMACARVGQSDRVKCEGRIVADYGTETNEFLLTTYRVKQEDGEWKWCGESD